MADAAVPIRILIVEDSPDDAALVMRELKKSGYAPEWERVETAEAMRAALGAKDWDLILSDFVIPGFGGLEALKIARGSKLDLPIILVSGQVGEETAVEAMKAGAGDFVMKDRLGRLGSVVKRELADAATRRNMRRAEIEWRAAFDSVRDPLFFHDREFRIVRANAAYAALAGKPVQDLIGKPYWEAFPKRDGPLAGCKAATEGDADHSEEDFRTPAGDTWTSRSSVIRDEHGKYLFSFHMMQDITERNRAAARLRAVLDDTIVALSMIVEHRDAYTAGHQRRTALLATAIGAELGFDPARREGLRIGALIHDIGVISLPAEILSRPGKVNPIEYQMIQGHSQIGHDIVRGIDFPWPIADMILQHHERLDGSGYPDGLKGDRILLEARVIGVADVVEAMCSHRPYRPALGIDKALDELQSNRGTHLRCGLRGRLRHPVSRKGLRLRRRVSGAAGAVRARRSRSGDPPTARRYAAPPCNRASGSRAWC